MNILHKTATTLLFAISIFGLNAQNINEFKEKLSLFDLDESAELARYVNVEIREDDSSKMALEALIEQNTDEESGELKKISIQGYRIGVFFDNGPSARAKAADIVARCNTLLPDIPTSMSYANPYFKVSAGYCISQEEAVMTLHRVQRHFPSAYLMREEITPADILKARNAEQAKKEAEAEERAEAEEANSSTETL